LVIPSCETTPQSSTYEGDQPDLDRGWLVFFRLQHAAGVDAIELGCHRSAESDESGCVGDRDGFIDCARGLHHP
jgi:hypothetical protein